MSKIQTLFYQQSGETVLELVGSDQTIGLRAADVEHRQSQFGPNELPKAKPVSPFVLFLSQFKDVLIIILLIAATISLGVSFIEKEGSLTESLLIYAIVVAIAVVGFLNEYKAEKTVEALRKLLGQTCRVRRDGKEVDIPAETLVPGDIVLFEEGKKIPGDMRLLSAHRLQVNEASLTGESLPVSKYTQPLGNEVPLADQRNMLFSGTLVTTGTAEAVVVGIGAHTEIGKIARLVSEVTHEETPMQRKLDDLGKKLGLVIMGICAVVFIIIFFLDREALTLDLTQRLIFAFTVAVALAVAAIPEGLAFVVRISLALGARRMATKNALVRKLSAVESLGSTDVICSDKTGTLTRGEMTVRQLYVEKQYYEITGSGYETKGQLRQANQDIEASDVLKRLLEIGVLCNNARLHEGQILGDPTEGSLLVSAAKVGLPHQELLKVKPRLHEIPFSSERKMMTTVHQEGTQLVVAVKGAADVLIDHCNKIVLNGKVKTLTKADRQAILDANKQLAAEALRVLGFAYKQIAKLPKDETELEEDLIFIGLQGMMDPPRVEVKDVIQRIQREAGMRVIMITGDNSITAQAIAKEIGIEGEAMTGTELEALSEAQLKEKVEEVGIFARVNPEHKIKIVRALQHHGHQVAMTGDGVNDAPAIKAADIGISMGITGTDASKEAADMILLDDQFVTIIKAVEEGRGIFDNVRKFVNFLLSCNIAEVIVVLMGILVHGDLVLTAAQLLFINIVTDGLPAIALGSDPAAKNVMKLQPKHYQQAILTKRVWTEIVVFGVLMSVALLVQYTLNLQAQGSMMAVSSVFIGMVVYEFVRLVDIRTDYKIRWWSNPWLTISMIASLIIQLVIIYWPPLATIFKVQPIEAIDWIMIVVGSIALFIIMKLLNPLFDRIGPENQQIRIIDKAT
jgi:Ca2+-transporting ATPase